MLPAISCGQGCSAPNTRGYAEDEAEFQPIGVEAVRFIRTRPAEIIGHSIDIGLRHPQAKAGAERLGRVGSVSYERESPTDPEEALGHVGGDDVRCFDFGLRVNAVGTDIAFDPSRTKTPPSNLLSTLMIAVDLIPAVGSQAVPHGNGDGNSTSPP
ncbi:hypothetical protein Trisim1_010383 [Trichoderma cf. simile WF8]